jgi:hypothetical protein
MNHVGRRLSSSINNVSNMLPQGAINLQKWTKKSLFPAFQNGFCTYVDMFYDKLPK